MRRRRKTGWRVLALLRRRGVLFPGRVGLRDAHYFHGGTWFQQPSNFPCIYLDSDGYVIFPDENRFCSCPGLSIGVNVNVPRGISSLTDYRRLNLRPVDL
jgi:hypothetical protein